MGRYVKTLRILGSETPLDFFVPSTRGTVHVLCGENSVGKSYVLRKLESLWRGAHENGFELETVERDDGLDGSVALYYGKIWKLKDRCGSFHFANTKKKVVAPSDGPVELFTSTLSFIYECAFRSQDGVDIGSFSDVSNWKMRLDLIERMGIEANAKTCYPCPMDHPLVQQFESVVDGYRLYYQFFHEKSHEICFEFVLVSPDGYVATQSKWSDGQKTVFYLLLNLYYQKSSFVILDEVENHMHPYYISKVLGIIRDSGRQCILSTHHPHVVFSEYVDRIFYVELEQNGSFPLERRPIPNSQTRRPFRRRVSELETDFEKITNAYKLFDDRDAQLLKLSRYYQNEVELRAYEIVGNIRCSNAPVMSSESNLPDKQSGMVNLGPVARILDVGAGYGRVRDELEKRGRTDAEWFLFNPDPKQHAKALERFTGIERVHAVSSYGEVDDGTMDVAIVANVVHEITPPAFRELLVQVERKLRPGGRLCIIDMEPLLYAEQYAVPYSYSEIESLLVDNGWACNHDTIPHRFVTLYIVNAEKMMSGQGDYRIEDLWLEKLRKSLAVYRSARMASMADYQKTLQSMTMVCSIESYLHGIWT